MVERLERIREDRLLRWSAYVAVPYLWLALALMNPLLLIVPPMFAFAIWKAIEYGIVERFDAPPDPDLF